MDTNQIYMLHGEYLHQHGFTGEGITIALLDAGFMNADTLTVFDSLFINQQILGTKDFVEGNDGIFLLGDKNNQ